MPVQVTHGTFGNSDSLANSKKPLWPQRDQTDFDLAQNFL